MSPIEKFHHDKVLERLNAAENYYHLSEGDQGYLEGYAVGLKSFTDEHVERLALCIANRDKIKLTDAIPTARKFLESVFSV